MPDHRAAPPCKFNKRRISSSRRRYDSGLTCLPPLHLQEVSESREQCGIASLPEEYLRPPRGDQSLAAEINATNEILTMQLRSAKGDEVS